MQLDVFLELLFCWGFFFFFFLYDDWVVEINIYSIIGNHPLEHCDLCASFSLLPESKSHIRISPWSSPTINNTPPPPQDWLCHLTCSITLFTCPQKCNISIVIYGYADHSPITFHDSGASDLSPCQHIDRIVM